MSGKPVGKGSEPQAAPPGPSLNTGLPGDFRSEALEASRRSPVVSQVKEQVRVALEETIRLGSSSRAIESMASTRELNQILAAIINDTRESPSMRGSAVKALANLGAEENLPVITDLIHDKKMPLEVRIAAIKGVKDFRAAIQSDAAPFLGEVALDPATDATLRKEAIAVLATVKDTSATKELISIARQFSTASPEGRLAVTGIGDLQDGVQAFAKDIQGLISGSPRDVQETLIKGLSRCKDPKSKELLAATLMDPAVGNDAKLGILTSIYEQDMDMVQPIQKLLGTTSDPTIRTFAIAAMTEIAARNNGQDDPSVLESLQSITTNKADSADVRLVATKALDILRGGRDSTTINLVQDKGRPIAERVDALQAVTSPTPQVKQALQRVASDRGEDAELRIAAANTLSRFYPTAGAKALTEIIESGTLNPAQNLSALRGLATTDGGTAAETILKQLKEAAINTEDAATLLVKTNSTRAVPTLLNMLDDPKIQAAARRDIVIALGSIGDPRAISKLTSLRTIPGLSDVSERALARLGDPTAVSFIQENNRGKKDFDGPTRAALINSPNPTATAAIAFSLTTASRPSQIALGDDLNGTLSAQQKVAFGNRLQEASKKESDPEKKRFLDEYGKAIVSAVTDLGIQNPFRCPPEFLINAVKERTSPRVDGRPLAVVVMSRADGNQFMEGNRESLAGLQKAGYRVMFYEAGTDTQLVDSLHAGTAQGQKADVIIMMGHGSRTAMALGGDDPRTSGQGVTNDAMTLTIQDERLLAGAGSTLKAGGTIVMVSCSLGEGGKGSDNMANMLRRAFPDAGQGRIFTATDPTRGPRIDFDPKTGEITNVHFTVPSYNATSPETTIRRV